MQTFGAMHTSPSHAAPVASTVVSVGPYALCRCARGRRCLKRAASAGGSASPPTSTCRMAVHADISGS